ncbi:MAG: DUF6265 family protein [Candidatus Thorarchaeota archaeon]|jgi:hypothetical protein
MTHSKTPLKGKTVSDLEFMTGAWRGEKEDDIFEEQHFDKSFTAWEEKETPLVFLLTELTDNKAVFVSSTTPDGGFLQYELIDSKTLRFSDFESDGSLSFELLFHKLY